MKGLYSLELDHLQTIQNPQVMFFFILYYASFEELQYFMYYQYVQTGELPAASVHDPPVNTDSHSPA